LKTRRDFGRRRALEERRAADLRILSGMRCETFDFTAYRTGHDLRADSHRVMDPDAGAEVTNYLWVFQIPTLVGPGRPLKPVTEIRVYTDVTGYPFNRPGTEVRSDVPWSPHFNKSGQVCIAKDFWEVRRGYIKLGELVVHIAHLLNWDEQGRGPGYQGFNPDAIEYHRVTHDGGPLNPGIRYPVLPWLRGGQPPADGEGDFQVVRR
jgi:hypothetical protein